MEKQKAVFKAYSDKTNGALIKLGDKEEWFKPDGKVKNFVSRIERGSNVLVVVDEKKKSLE